MGSITQLTNRLVGDGRLEDAERWIEEAYEVRFPGAFSRRFDGCSEGDLGADFGWMLIGQSRHFGEYQEAGAGYDHNFKTGELKNRDGMGPLNRLDKWVSSQAIRCCCW
jgi:hypothetical protein